jgi:predicted RNase H-like HicB family nuclease
LILRVGITIHKEDGWYVALDTVSGVASQGKTCGEALKNFREALEMWFENAEEWEKERAMQGQPVAAVILEFKF